MKCSANLTMTLANGAENHEITCKTTGCNPATIIRTANARKTAFAMISALLHRLIFYQEKP